MGFCYLRRVKELSLSSVIRYRSIMIDHGGDENEGNIKALKKESSDKQFEVGESFL